ncbi:MAG: helix-turn-helix domain-containing protein [Solirubrobacterales bacterium]
MDQAGIGRWPPYTNEPSLREMTRELEIDFDDFIKSMGQNVEVQTMAERYGISEATMQSLADHFLHHGINTVVGGD